MAVAIRCIAQSRHQVVPTLGREAKENKPLGIGSTVLGSLLLCCFLGNVAIFLVFCKFTVSAQAVPPRCTYPAGPPRLPVSPSPRLPVSPSPVMSPLPSLVPSRCSPHRLLFRFGADAAAAAAAVGRRGANTTRSRSRTSSVPVGAGSARWRAAALRMRNLVHISPGAHGNVECRLEVRKKDPTSRGETK